MLDRWVKDRKWIISGGGRACLLGGVCWLFGVVFAVFGVIADATNGTLGLEAISWFPFAIAALVASVSWCLGWMVAVYLDAVEVKGKKAK